MKHLELAENAVVADIGAGPGYLTLFLARAVPRGKVIATDIRADYLEVLRSRARSLGVGNIETRVVPRDHPLLDEDSIDLAVLCQVDQYLPDRTAYFQSLRPALRDRGRIALVNYREFHDADAAAAHAAGFRVVHEWSPSPSFFLIVLEPR